MPPNAYSGVWLVFAITGIIFFILQIIAGLQAA